MATVKRQNPSEPTVYLPSKSAPDWRKEEAKYVLNQIYSERKTERWQAKGSPLLDPSRDVDSKDTLAEYYLGQIRRRRNLAVNSKRRPGQRATDFVIKAIEIFGIDALRLDGPEESVVRGKDKSVRSLSITLDTQSGTVEQRRQSTQDMRLPSLEIKDQLGAAVCSVIRGLREQVLKGNSYANKRLQNILKALIPETRGKKGINTEPFDVLSFYYKEMFRLYHIQNALRSTPGSRSEKVKAASENFGMTVEQTREVWNLDDTDESKGRPVSIKEMTRMLTCRRFGIAQQTLSNIIASYP